MSFLLVSLAPTFDLDVLSIDHRTLSSFFPGPLCFQPLVPPVPWISSSVHIITFYRKQIWTGNHLPVSRKVSRKEVERKQKWQVASQNNDGYYFSYIPKFGHLCIWRFPCSLPCFSLEFSAFCPQVCFPELEERP